MISGQDPGVTAPTSRYAGRQGTCIVARLGLDGWEAFTVDQAERVGFTRWRQG